MTEYHETGSKVLTCTPCVRRPALFVVAMFIVSIVITLLSWRLLPVNLQANESSDYRNFYRPAARNLIAGRGLSTASGDLDLRYPAGYPLVLAGVFALSDLLNFSEETTVRAFTLLCTSVASILLFLLARSVWGVEGALISSIAWATCPLVLWLTKQPNSELPFFVAFYGSFSMFWFAVRHKSGWWFHYFLTGVLVGLAMLIRPFAIGVGGAMGLSLWIVARERPRRVRLLLIAVMLSGNFLALVPWELWVYVRTGEIVMLSTNAVPALRDGLTFAVNQKKYREGTGVPQDVKLLMIDLNNRRDEMRSAKDVLLVLLDELYVRPLSVAKLLGIKLTRSWYGTDSQRFERLVIAVQLGYIFFIMWSSKAAWELGGSAKELTLCVWLMTLYFWGINTSSTTLVRYMVPAMGLLFLLLPAIVLNRKSLRIRRND